MYTIGLLHKRNATCYPAPKFIEMIENRVDDKVCVDGHIITSQGPGTALIFSLKLVEILFGMEKAEAVAEEMIV